MASGIDVRETFARMAMNDEETVALVAGGTLLERRMALVTPRWSVPSPKLRPLKSKVWAGATNSAAVKA